MHTILVIDDEQRLRDNLSEILELNDFEVHTAKDGLEGFAKAVSIVPDIILCDIMMPNVNGYEFLERIKSTELDYIPVIFLSAKIEREDERKGMSLGADDYIKKPFSAAEVISSVNARLEKTQKLKKIVTLSSNKSTFELSKLLNGHEIRTPLNIISGMNMLLFELAHPNKKKEAEQIMKYTQCSVYNMTSIINNIYVYEILKLSIDTELFLENTNINIVGNIEKLAREFDREVVIKCSTEIFDHLQYLYLKNYICVELVYNAIKFSKLETTINFSCFFENNYKIIVVKNKGNGFNCNPELIKPFNKFSGQMDISGLGLGLYNIKIIIEKLKGTLHIESNNDETIIKVQLPNS